MTWPGPVEAGKPLHCYSGDDSRREVDDSRGEVDDSRGEVAVFNDDGTGEWRELTFGDPSLRGDKRYVDERNNPD